MSAFSELAGRALWRAVWHFMLMAVACTLLITCCRWFSSQRIFEVSRKAIAGQFGNLKVSPAGGLIVGKTPDKAAVLQLPGGISMCYIPAEIPEELPDYEKNSQAGLIFSPSRILLWLGTPVNSLWNVEPDAGGVQVFQLSDAELRKQLAAPEAGVQIPPDRSAGAILLQLIENPALLIPSALLLVLAIILMQTVPTILLFALIFGWFGSFRSSGLLTMKEVFTVVFYASLPVMLISSLFPALELPFIDFNTVFSLGTVVFSLIALNYVIMKKLESRTAPSGDGN